MNTQITKLYPAPKYINIDGKIDQDPPVIEEVNLYQVNQAYISTYGYIIKNAKILKETVSFRHRDSISFKNIVSFLFLKNKIKISIPALSIAHGWYDSYYHFTIESLPKLYLLRDFISRSTLVFPKNIMKFHSEWFNILNVTNITFIDNNEIVYTPLAISTSFTSRDLNHHNIILPEFRNWVIDHIQNINSIKYDKIFIGRQNATRRKILNLEEVKETLTKLGYIYIEMEDYSVVDQIKLFHNAKQIISVHGAALANMCFASSYTKILDLIVAEFKQWCFLKMAIILNIDYDLFPCKGDNNNEAPGYQNIIIDIKKLENRINQWNQ